jgi:hypothetical protein
MPFAGHAGRVIFPLDEELALLPGGLSPNLAEGAARLGSWMPFGQASSALQYLAGARVSEATVRRATLGAGEALVALEEKAVDLLEVEAPPAPAGAAWQQLSVDGAMVPLVGGDWAEARTLVLGRLGCEKDRLQARDLSYFSRMTDHATFTRLATLATHRQGVEHAQVVLAVNDGAEWIQELLDVQCPAAVRILDWAHASGYVHQAGHAVFGETCGAWCAAQLTTLRYGEPIAVLVELARLADTLADASPARETVLQGLAYLAKRYEQVQYATFAKLGYPIGSGIVESANKVVVEARLKGAGMHWAPVNVNPLLALRGIACSGRWDAVWPSIAAQRRHAARVRRACRHDERRASRSPRPPRPPRPPATVGGRPTRDHPWNRHPAVRPRRAKL